MPGVGSTGQIGTNGDEGVPDHAVRQGHFAVWTEPKDPGRRQDYRIVIEVTLPESVTEYERTDLSGYVHGTDTYRQSLAAAAGPRADEETFEFKPGRARVGVWVPGGNELVRDVVAVRSEVLGEEELIALVF